MIDALSPLFRRAIAVSILLALLTIVWAGIFGPLVEAWRDHQAAVARSLSLLSAYRRNAAERPAREAQIRELEGRDDSDHEFLEGANSALIAAKLQSELKQAVEAEAGQVTSTQILQSIDDGGMEKIAVRVEFKSSTDALPKILYGIEAHRPLLFVENPMIRSPDSPSNAPTSPSELTVRWDIAGYARGIVP